VPNEAYLLDAVKIETEQTPVRASELKPYVRQNPNGKWFGLFKTQLHIYSLSGRDSTRWYNRLLRKIGNPPVIYDDAQAERSRVEITHALQNMGYIGARVERTEARKDKKLKLTYHVRPGKAYTVSRISYHIPDSTIYRHVRATDAASMLHEDMAFDINVLDAERQRIADVLQQQGYYKFNKDFITYDADTVAGTYRVDLRVRLQPYRFSADSVGTHRAYSIREVSFVTDYDATQASFEQTLATNDSLHYNGYPIYYNERLSFRPKVLTDNLFIRPHALYSERDVQRTYNNLGRMSALRYTNIRFTETSDNNALDAYVILTPSKPHSVSFELEGTNSAGDLGAAAAVSYQHRNLFKGSERLLIRFRGAYEAISGLGNEYQYDNYVENSVEANLNFPNFLFPFLSSDFKRGIRASSEFSLLYNYQLRPEFSRLLTSASWGYRWQQGRNQHRVDLIDINYLFMPWISEQFRKDYLENENNYILEYNYKNRFIMHAGYSFNYNSIGGSLINNNISSDSYSIRAGIESAGNLLYGISSLLSLPKNSANEYSIFEIPFAQYIKVDFDFAANKVITPGNSFAYHVGLGLAVPYGNARVLPFEKQYFSGGANSVRGWAVRNLGPGSFPGDGNFLNHSGEIKFDASVELRSELFWKLQGAAFIDAGNIWTLRNNESQPGGQFRFNTFYKQIAVAYGLGLRLNMDFIVIRFDGGMKAINPVYKSGRDRYPLLHPRFSRDFAFHFAVGYPF
jgi:outer membrane protein assembly factor BamA